MTVFYILLAALICYGLLLLFKQQALLKDRITRLERQKQETEEMLLQFMQQVNGLTKTDEPPSILQSKENSENKENAERIILEEKTERSVQQIMPKEQNVLEEPVIPVQETALLDVKDQLENGADLDALARSLNRGTGEVALIAKLSQKTKVARR